MHLLARLVKTSLLLALFLVCWMVVVRLPSQSVPWGPLDLNAPVGAFTGLKLAALRGDARACHSALLLAGIEARSLPDVDGGKCPRENQALLERSRYPYSSTVKGDCAMIAALAVWEREAVARAAQLHLTSDVRSIDHLGIFSCRNVRGSTRRPSQHSLARAIDIAGFRLEDGTRISLRSDWDKDDAGGRFLRAVRDMSCPIFRGVLSPDYNALHADHFHLDMGPYDICR